MQPLHHQRSCLMIKKQNSVENGLVPMNGSKHASPKGTSMSFGHAPRGGKRKCLFNKLQLAAQVLREKKTRWFLCIATYQRQRNWKSDASSEDLQLVHAVVLRYSRSCASTLERLAKFARVSSAVNAICRLCYCIHMPMLFAL